MPHLSATRDDLPPPVAATLDAAKPGLERSLTAGPRRWGYLEWARADADGAAGRSVLLIHGVTSDAGIWWRVGPALQAAGYRVLALDLPGHGRTGAWEGRHRFAQTAQDVAAFIAAAGLGVDELAVVGHSWGGMVTAHLPIAGIRPRVLVLLDPPARTRTELEPMLVDPTELPYATITDAMAAVRAVYPTWSDHDVEAKAEGLTRFVPDAVRAILLDNGSWDAGMAALRDPAATDVPVWLIRGEWANGGLIPEDAVPGIEEQLGAQRVITITGGPHSPMRTHPEATILALLRALAS